MKNRRNHYFMIAKQAGATDDQADKIASRKMAGFKRMQKAKEAQATPDMIFEVEAPDDFEELPAPPKRTRKRKDA